MRGFRLFAVTAASAGLLAGVVGAAAPGALAGSSPGSSVQTHPRVRPRIGHRHSTFHLTFTLAVAPSSSALQTTAYRTVISAPAGSRASCSPSQPAEIVSGAQGSVAKVPLRPSARGWCRGRYAVTVFLEQTVTCGPLATPGSMACCGPPVEAADLARIPLCPVTAGAVRSSSTLDTGTAHFRVR